MSGNGEITAVYADGVLRPDARLDLPENALVHITIRRVGVTPEQEARGREMIRKIRESGGISLGGWHPTRDEMHERD